MAWPQHFLDAGFTDREIVPGVRWEFDADIPNRIRLDCDGCDFRVYDDSYLLIGESRSHIELVFGSVEDARKAAEDLVCRLHGVPTEAERELQEYQRIWNDPMYRLADIVSPAPPALTEIVPEVQVGNIHDYEVQVRKGESTND